MDKMAVRPAFPTSASTFPSPVLHSHRSARVCRLNAETNLGVLPTRCSELTNQMEQSNNTEHAPRKTCPRKVKSHAALRTAITDTGPSH